MIAALAETTWHGLHWQTAPLLPGVLIGVALLIFGGALRRARLLFVAVAAIGVVLAGGARYAFPVFEFPEPTGQYAVGVGDFEWDNGVRAKIWYPAAPQPGDAEAGYFSSFDGVVFGLPGFIAGHLKGRFSHAYENSPFALDAPAPVAVYAHSADGHNEENTFLLTDLASHGFVVVAVNNTTALTGYDFDLAALSTQPEAFAAAMTNVVMADRRPEIASAVIGLSDINDAAGPLQGVLDLSAVNFVGFSLGGALVADYCSQADNCRAIVNLDGNPFAVAADRGLTSPYLHLSQTTAFENVRAGGASEAAIAFAELYTEDVGAVIDKTIENGAQAQWLALRGSGHGSFSDYALWVGVRWGALSQMLGSSDSEASFAVIRDATRVFLEDPASYSNGGDSEAPYLTPFQDVRPQQTSNAGRD